MRSTNLSRFVVGSSRAIIPQEAEKVSASASRMMREASTFWPAEHRPRMSISVPFFTMTTLQQDILTTLQSPESMLPIFSDNFYYPANCSPSGSVSNSDPHKIWIRIRVQNEDPDLESFIFTQIHVFSLVSPKKKASGLYLISPKLWHRKA